MTPIRSIGESWQLRHLGILGDKGSMGIDLYVHGQTDEELLREGIKFCEGVNLLLDSGSEREKAGDGRIRAALFQESDGRKVFDTGEIDPAVIDSLLAEASVTLKELLTPEVEKPSPERIQRARDTLQKLSGVLYRTDLENLRHFKQRRSLKSCG